jgi:NAD(P) transhydrogenase subunit alpha
MQSFLHPAVTTFTIFVLASFVGYYVIWKVTPALHTPLMSVTNAISGIILLGAMITFGYSTHGVVHFLSGVGVLIASINIVGGFLVTARMVKMYKTK